MLEILLTGLLRARLRDEHRGRGRDGIVLGPLEGVGRALDPADLAVLSGPVLVVLGARDEGGERSPGPGDVVAASALGLRACALADGHVALELGAVGVG